MTPWKLPPKTKPPTPLPPNLDALTQKLGETFPNRGELNATIDNKVDPVVGVSIEEFGAVGNDPTFDNKAALDAAFAAGVPLIVPGKSYRLATKLNRSFTGAHITGLPGARIYSDTLAEIVYMITTDGAEFHNIIFETTVTAAGESGAMFLSYASIKNVLWNNCTFRAPNAAVNAIKFVVDNLAVEYGLDNVIARHCLFDRVGRMGIEVQDHTASPTYTKVRNVGAEYSTFKDCGKILHGIDLSFSGPIVAAVSKENRFIGSVTIAAEFAGAQVSPVATRNKFIGLGDSAMTLSFTSMDTDAQVPNALIEGNQSIGRSGAGARFWNLADARMSNNTFLIKSYIHFRDSTRTLSQGDTYDSTGTYALFAEHSVAAKELSYNEWRNANMVTTSAGAFSVARFQGAKAIRNKIVDSRLSRVAGSRIDQTGSATTNQIVRCQRDTNHYVAAKTITLADADRTLTLEDIDAEALIFAGTASVQRSIVFPSTVRGWRVRNATTQNLNLHAGGTGTILAPGASMFYALDSQTPSYA